MGRKGTPAKGRRGAPLRKGFALPPAAKADVPNDPDRPLSVSRAAWARVPVSRRDDVRQRAAQLLKCGWPPDDAVAEALREDPAAQS